MRLAAKVHGSSARRSAAAKRPASSLCAARIATGRWACSHFGIDEHRRGVHAQPRHQPGEAAAGADEGLGAGDDLRLHAQVVLRRHPGPGADDPRAGVEPVVGVVVLEHEPRVQQHDRNLARHRRQHRPQLGANQRRVGQRLCRVELHRHVFARQERRIDELRRLHPGEPGVSVHEAHRPLARPVQGEQAVHQTRVDHVEVAAADLPRHVVQDLAVEIRRLEVLGGAPLQVAAGERGRVDVIPNLHVVARHALVPAGDAAARDSHDAIRVDVERALEPVEERHPVQRLEPHLGEPGADHQPAPARDQRLQLVLDRPLGAVELLLFPHLRSMARRGPQRPSYPPERVLGQR